MGPNDRTIGERSRPVCTVRVPALPAPPVSARISPLSMVSSGVSMVIWPPAPLPEVPLASPLPPADGDRLGAAVTRSAPAAPPPRPAGVLSWAPP